MVAWEAGAFLTVARDGPGVAARSGPTQQAGLLAYVAMAAAEVGDLAAGQRHLETAGRVLANQRFWIMSDHYDRACGRVAWVAGDGISAATYWIVLINAAVWPSGRCSLANTQRVYPP